MQSSSSGSRKKTCSLDGCERKHNAWGYCRVHYQRAKKGQDLHKPVKEWGTGWVTEHGYREVFKDGRTQKEHRYIYEQFLGRPLEAHENVHHKNGDKLDNRLENLELWSTKQPKGQSVEDKIQYALEILTAYASHMLA